MASALRRFSALTCFVCACSLAVDATDLTGGAARPQGGEDGGGADVALPSSPDSEVPDAEWDAAADGAPSYVDMVRADAPVAYFRFEESVGANTVFDEARKVNVPAKGAIKFQTPGAFGAGIELSGTETLDLGDVFDFAGLTPYSLEAWVKAKPMPEDQRIFTKRGGQPLLGYILYINNDFDAGGLPLRFEHWGAALSASVIAPVDEFVHVVVTVSYETGTGNAAIFVNGQDTGTGGYDNADAQPDTPYSLIIGNSFYGVLDELAIYDRALSREQIASHSKMR